MSAHRWLESRWRDLDRRPAGNAVPGTTLVATLAGLAGLVAMVLPVGPPRPDRDAAALLGAGAGLGCLVVATAGLYHLCARLDLGRAGRLMAVAVLLVNPDLVGAVAVPRSALLLAGVLPALAGLARWARATRTPSGGELAVFVGFPATVAVFSGVEGWALVLLAGAVLAGVQLRRGQGVRSALTRVASVAAVPVAAGGWWLVRGVVRGGAPGAVLPAPDHVLSTGAGVALVCLLVAVPVLAALARLVRDELSGRRLSAPAERTIELPRQRRPPSEVSA